MAHKFDPSKVHILNDPSRLEFFDPEEILKASGLKEGMVALDVGTGPGFYLPYLSKIVGESGKVYAIDVQEDMVKLAREKVKNLNLGNVEILKSEENSIPISDNVVDFIYMAFTFHELTDPVEFLKELRRVSKEASLLLLIDWKKEEREIGPPSDEVYSEEEVVSILRKVDVKVDEVFEVSGYHFGIRASISKL